MLKFFRSSNHLKSNLISTKTPLACAQMLFIITHVRATQTTHTAVCPPDI